jgi:peptide/nickel transport system permease protein
LLFVALRLAGDPVLQLAGLDARPEDIDAMRHSMGFDRPVLEQYGAYLQDVLTHGSFGASYRQHVPVEELIFSRLPFTLVLAVSAMALSVLIAFPTGILSALHRGSWIDTFAVGMCAVAQSVPEFWIGLLLILTFAVNLRVLPSGGAQNWNSLLLPAVAVALPELARLTRMMRSSLLEVAQEDYIRTARAKGLAARAVIYGHALRNSLIAPLTFAGLQWARMLGGVVVAEQVFSWPGVGRLLLDALKVRDFPIVISSVFYIALVFLLMNLLVDLLYAALDPRIRYGTARS